MPFWFGGVLKQVDTGVDLVEYQDTADAAYTIPQPGIPLSFGTNVIVGPWLPVGNARGIRIETGSTGEIEGYVDWSYDDTPEVTPAYPGVKTFTTTKSGPQFAGGGDGRFSLPTGGKYYRIRVDVHDAGGVTFFARVVRLAAIEQPFMFPLGSRADPTWDSLVVKSLGTGQQPDGEFVNQKADGLAVTSVATLGAGGVFTSPWIDTDGWASAEIIIATDQVSATEGIRIEFTDDVQAGTPTVRSTRNFTFDAAQVVNGSATYRFPTEIDGLRVKYTNGGTGQGSFFLAVTLRTQSANPQSSLETDLNSTNIAIMTRGIINARNDSGTYANIKRASGGGFRVAINEHETSTPIRALTNFDMNQANVGTSAVQIVGSPLSGRKTVAIKALAGNNAKVYVGKSGVTTGSGWELNSSEVLILEIDDAAAGLYAISVSGTQRVCWAEVA